MITPRLCRKYVQSVSQLLAGVAMNVIALTDVAKIEIPLAHQGILRPARKNSSVESSRRAHQAPSARRRSP